jgi:hypothetical protein
LGKKTPAAPAAPDYAAAATAQGTANLTAANQGSVLSNPNIISPYGNQTVTWGQPDAENGNARQATVTQTLTPQAQAALDAQQHVQMGEANLASQGLDKASDVLKTGFNYQGPKLQTSLDQGRGVNYGPGFTDSNSLNMGPGQTSASSLDMGPAADQYGLAGGINAARYGQATNRADLSGVAAMPVNAGTTGQQAIMQRLSPQIEQTRAATAQRLANQGIPEGSEAWNNEMRQQGQNFNDLYSQAALQGINLDMSANNQGFNQAQTNAGLYNSALAQNFGQGVQGQALTNQAIGQNFGQGVTSANTRNAAQAQLFSQNLAADQAQNAAQGQLFNQNATQSGLYNAAQNQQYNQGLQSANFGNAAQQSDWQQQLAQYNQPLNQVTALMSGSQIQNPQFQAYTGQNVAAAPIFQGAQAAGQQATDLYGQQMAGYNAQMGALGGLLGGAAGMISPIKIPGFS